MGFSAASSLLSRLLTASVEFLFLGFIVWLLLSLFTQIRPHWRRRIWLVVICKPVVTVLTSSLSGIIPLPATFSKSWLGGLMFPAPPTGEGFPAGETVSAVFVTLAHLWVGITMVSLICVWCRAMANRQLVDESIEKGFGISPESLKRLDPTLVLPKNAKVIVTPEDYGPVAMGVLEPVVVVPEALLPWVAKHRGPSRAEQARLCQIIRHEFAHIENRDYLMTLICHIVLSFFWFHPVAHLACRRLRMNSEFCCDERVLQSGTDAQDYAKTLMNTVSGKLNSRGMVLAFFSDNKPARVLHDRLENILSSHRAMDGKTSFMGVAAMVILVAALPRFLTVGSPSLGTPAPGGQVTFTAADGSVWVAGPDGKLVPANYSYPQVGIDGTKLAGAVNGDGGIAPLSGEMLLPDASNDTEGPVLADTSDGESMANADESEATDEDDEKPKKHRGGHRVPVLIDQDDANTWPSSTSVGSHPKSN